MLLFSFVNCVFLLLYYIFFLLRLCILIVMYVPFWVFCLCCSVLWFVCKCVMFYCYQVSAQLCLTNISTRLPQTATQVDVKFLTKT